MMGGLVHFILYLVPTESSIIRQFIPCPVREIEKKKQKGEKIVSCQPSKHQTNMFLTTIRKTFHTTATTSLRRFQSTRPKIAAPPLVYISGEEFTRYAGQLYLDNWIKPYVDTR